MNSREIDGNTTDNTKTRGMDIAKNYIMKDKIDKILHYYFDLVARIRYV
jgi:hypothetical protein